MIKREGNIILGNIEIKKYTDCISYYRKGIKHREYFPSLIYCNKNILYGIMWIKEDSWHRNSGPAYVEFKEDGICLQWYIERRLIKEMKVKL